MFKDRFFSGTVLALLSIAVLTVGGPILAVTLFLISVAGFWELTKVAGVYGDNKKLNLASVLGIFCIAVYYSVVYFIGDMTYIVMAIIFAFSVFMAMYVIKFPKYHANQIMAMIFSFLYAPLMLSFVYLTRSLEYGGLLVWMILITSWVSDTFAYAVGMITGKTIGNHKIFPKLSPKKSLEGCIAGLVGTTVVCALYGHFFVEAIIPGKSIMWNMALIGAIGSVIAQIGDLAASAFKRNHDVKDFGKIIPGHGGIMDRFDSVIYTAPMVYFLMVLLIL